MFALKLTKANERNFGNLKTNKTKRMLKISKDLKTKLTIRATLCLMQIMINARKMSKHIKLFTSIFTLHFGSVRISTSNSFF